MFKFRVTVRIPYALSILDVRTERMRITYRCRATEVWASDADVAADKVQDHIRVREPMVEIISSERVGG